VILLLLGGAVVIHGLDAILPGGNGIPHDAAPPLLVCGLLSLAAALAFFRRWRIRWALFGLALPLAGLLLRLAHYGS